uniref:Uncharacterized protein n=1 Tax=Alexandrium monilatum TaxID=311494 RepID=A0A7S4UI14_9DINO|mmetsp:Transcript_33290/g.99137  ORF Transcript_33290/g.99137 Transcript_33290/m.99137 type:complete len:139 (-) Transcript_33290:72-488(-)|eukprot:CAMPEP_0175243256 /NCGR_PEP_ID=MMETSP0093-20121207/31489_1 /TAXON_ID=311494 /ORGANISM="Alexandrium monilatum, Strain CCMP3105" /LENGTH=138 /DNA_ID=CAMNT_0016537355 /DNA_START=64 /DNA_END=480 /DNA_ORIENTATION=-
MLRAAAAVVARPRLQVRALLRPPAPAASERLVHRGLASVSSAVEAQRTAPPLPAASDVSYAPLGPQTVWPSLRLSALLPELPEGGPAGAIQEDLYLEYDGWDCANRAPLARIPKPANRGSRPRCVVMRKLRKRLKTGR